MSPDTLRRRIRVALAVMIAGLVLSGATAIPLQWELDTLAGLLAPEGKAGNALARWIVEVRDGLTATYARHPFIAYGTDWLAFAHFVLAILFVGPWRDPVRNEWVITFGIIACILVLPTAIVFGTLRGVPPGWIAIDCSFGVLGAIPLLLARRWTRELAALTLSAVPRDPR